MLAEMGRFFFLLGLGVAIVSYVVSMVMLACGMPPPDPIRYASGLVAAMSGLKLDAAKNIFTAVSVGILSVGLFIASMFRGKAMHFDVGKIMALTAYLALFTVAADGVSIVLRGCIPLYLSQIPPLAGVAPILVNVLYFLALVSLGYYLMVRVFGVPAE